MSVAHHDVSRGGPDLHRLDRMVVPRWLREHRRAQARAARPDAVAADIADEVVDRTSPAGRRRWTELMRATERQAVRLRREYRREDSGLTSAGLGEPSAPLSGPSGEADILDTDVFSSSSSVAPGGEVAPLVDRGREPLLLSHRSPSCSTAPWRLAGDPPAC